MLKNNKKSILYISYDGILEPLGQSQVLAYLLLLASEYSIHLISFEKGVDWSDSTSRDMVAKNIVTAGIVWHPMRYHKSPAALATAWDIFSGIALGLWLIIRYRLHIVHARSYVPSVMALTLKLLTGAKFLFDMRGFWADERVDCGLWVESSYIYFIAKWFERHFLLKADHIVSLTQKAVSVIENFDYLRGCMPPYTVIPTCADLNCFKPSLDKLGNNFFVLGYVGTANNWYLFDNVAITMAVLLRINPNARFLVVNRGEHDFIRQRLQIAGVPDSVTEIISATHGEVPALMARMNAGIFFIKPAFSKQASAPTKLAEFLGCGIPCLSNEGVGDMAEVLEVDRVGIAIKSFDQASLSQGLEQLLKLCADPEVSGRCVAAAHRHFSLDEGVARYRAIYASLGEAV